MLGGRGSQTYSILPLKRMTGGRGQAQDRRGAHPAEGDNVEGVFPPVDGIQKLWLGAAWVAVELQLSHSVPREVRTDLADLAVLSAYPCRGQLGTMAGRLRGPAPSGDILTFQEVPEVGWGLVSAEVTSSAAETSGRRSIYRFEEGKGRGKKRRSLEAGAISHPPPHVPSSSLKSLQDVHLNPQTLGAHLHLTFLQPWLLPVSHGPSEVFSVVLSGDAGPSRSAHQQA